MRQVSAAQHVLADRDDLLGLRNLDGRVGGTALRESADDGPVALVTSLPKLLLAFEYCRSENAGAGNCCVVTRLSVLLTPVGLVVTSLLSGVIVGFIVALVVSAFTRASDPRAVI